MEQPTRRTADFITVLCLPRRLQKKLAYSYSYSTKCKLSYVAARQRLRSASSSSLIVGRTRLSTIGDRAFPVAAARIWNSLPRHVTSARSLLVFQSRLKSQDSSLHHFLSQSLTMYSARAVTFIISDTLIVRVTYLYSHRPTSTGLLTASLQQTACEL